MVKFFLYFSGFKKKRTLLLTFQSTEHANHYRRGFSPLLIRFFCVQLPPSQQRPSLYSLINNKLDALIRRTQLIFVVLATASNEEIKRCEMITAIEN